VVNQNIFPIQSKNNINRKQITESMAGVLKKDYHTNRQSSFHYKYRLNRRTFEVKNIIEKYLNERKISCLDIGTADGLMLSKLNRFFNFEKVIGIDMSKELIETNKDKNINLQLGNAEELKFEDESFNLIIACAVIEHVDNPSKMLSECRRVLKKGGILILTSPNQIYDKLVSLSGYIKDEEHVETMNLKKMKQYLKKNKFKIIFSKYFMFFPIFKFPFEESIESFLRRIGLSKIMTNQIAVGKK